MVVWNGIIWQCFFLGAIGVIFSASSLVCGIVIAVLLPVTEILAVIFFQEKFQAEKGVSLALSLWGFVSYFYGEIKDSKKTKNPTPETELPQTVNPWQTNIFLFPRKARDRITYKHLPGNLKKYFVRMLTGSSADSPNLCKGNAWIWFLNTCLNIEFTWIPQPLWAEHVEKEII